MYMMNLTISNLKTLNPQQLKQTKQSLEKFFYKVGMNIAVYNAERYQSSIDFRRNIEEAIEKFKLQAVMDARSENLKRN